MRHNHERGYMSTVNVGIGLDKTDWPTIGMVANDEDGHTVVLNFGPASLLFRTETTDTAKAGKEAARYFRVMSEEIMDAARGLEAGMQS